MISRYTGILIGLLYAFSAFAQGDVTQVRTKADALFKEERFAEAMPLYSQLISLNPSDHDLSYRYGTCVLHGGDKEKAVGYLKYASTGSGLPAAVWYWLGRALHLNYQFKDALDAYAQFKGKAEKKDLAAMPVDALEKQCHNGQNLLSDLKEIDVRKKVEVDADEFFRFYDLSDIGGKIVVMPDELRSSLDKKKEKHQLIYLPDRPGPIYFSSYGKDGKTGKDIYRTEVMPNGSFATPVKIPGYINTDQDEDFPFLHSDGKTFYFSSKGHNSMGGYDVFKATYDSRSDGFGTPENLDFAVNTPDDDFLYIVDPEHKEACFASSRSSHQGKLHVYRVSTSQVPLVITVLQGTFTNEIEKTDRKARIVVEDALSRDRITEVRTADDGSYVLALPRSGKFRFLVECGPSGKTHVGTVDVPGNDEPRAFRQELALTRSADQEKLVIRNFFDQPLEGDLIALALDEIRRRASLDVNEKPVVQSQPSAAFDVLTRAGFTGEMDQETVQRMADDDAREQEVLSEDLDQQVKHAYAIALEAVAEAETITQEAENASAEALLVNDEKERYAKMSVAADRRNEAKIATTRARIAFRTAKDLEAERIAMDQKAATASKLAADIRTTLAQKQETSAVQLLTSLKERLDQKARPEQDPDPVVRAERAMLEKEKEAKAALQRANSSRLDATDLSDRIKRLVDEKERTKNNKRKEEIDRELTQYRGDLAALGSETQTKFKQLRELEMELLDLRGEYALKKHLATTTTEPATISSTQLDDLADRIATADSRFRSLHVDERFAANIEEKQVEINERIFEWGSPVTSAQADDRVATVAADRDASHDASHAGSRTIPIHGSGSERSPQDVDVSHVPVQSNDVPDPIDDIDPADPSTEPGVNAAGVATIDPQAFPIAETPTLTPEQIRNAEDPENGLPRNTGNEVIDAATERFLLENRIAELEQLKHAQKDPAKRDSVVMEQAQAQEELQAIDAVIDEASTANAENEDDLWEPVDLDRVPMVFNQDTKEEELIGTLFSEYYSHREALEKLGDQAERSNGLHGLELMLSDSLRAEMARQLMVLELAPEQADRILPRVDRLREIREIHLNEAQKHLLSTDEIAEQQEIGTDERSQIDEVLIENEEPVVKAETGTLRSENNEVTEGSEVNSGADTTRSMDPPGANIAEIPAELPPADPIEDHFVQIHDDPLQIYQSRIQHRSTEVIEGLERRRIDLEKMATLSLEIDSARNQLATVRKPKEQDKVRKNLHRMIDDRLITRTELGQRSAYLIKEEWRTANDSLRTLQRNVGMLGLSSNEPVMLMALEYRDQAVRELDKASQIRRSADRTQDIIVRDSLYRKAYALELQALIQLDRSITTHNYLLSASHIRGERITYEELAAKVLLPGRSVVAAADRVPADQVLTIQDDPVQFDPPTTESGAIIPPTTTDPTIAARLDTARIETAQLVKEKEEKLPAEARTIPKKYESLLADAPAAVDPRTIEPVEDPELLRKLITTTLEESVALDRKAMEMADRATALEDSAATVTENERETVKRMALRSRQISDSLRTGSLMKAQEAKRLEVKEKQALQNDLFHQRLVKFYYLDADEQVMVMQAQDVSRYFQAKALALAQLDASLEAGSAASANRSVAEELRSEAGRFENEAGNGRMSAMEAAERSRILIEKAEALALRADSLSAISDRLRAASAKSEEDAATVLKGMDPQDASELSALELRTRRTKDQTEITKPVAIAQRTDPIAKDEVAAIGTERGTEDEVNVEPVPGPDRSSITPADPVIAQPAREVQRNDVKIRLFEMPAELESDIFELRPEGERVAQPIIRNAEMPKGLVFKVQIGAFRNQIEDEVFSDMTPVMGEDAGNGLTRYTAGLFNSFDQAFIAKDKVRSRGYRDAFVVAYLNGVRIPLGEAMRAARSGDLASVDTPSTPVETDQDRSAQERSVNEDRNTDRAANNVPNTPVDPQQNGNVDPNHQDPIDVVPSTSDRATTINNNAVMDRNVDRPEIPAERNDRTEVADQPRMNSTANDTIGRTGTTGTGDRVAIENIDPQISEAQETERILKSYPPSAEEIIAQFKPTAAATNYYPVKGVAPARPVEMIMGLFFTVQVGVYTKPVELDKLYNITPLVSELTETEKIRYSTGVYPSMDDARARRLQIVDLGVKDAFVTAYLNGKRIPIRDAVTLLEEHGPGVLAKP